MGSIVDNERLITEWNWEKNNILELYPDKLTDGMNRKVWWKCEKGHEWEAKIINRTHGANCPYCSGRYPVIGETDLATTHPFILDEWDYEKNKPLLPSQVSFGSNKKVWWICDKQHSYQASISNRTHGTGCPFCLGRKVLVGFNDLETVHPEIAKQWNYNKNGDLLPTQVTSGSNKKVWWLCENGHEWKTAVHNRVYGTNCPECSKENYVSNKEIKTYFYIKKYFPDAISGYKNDDCSISELDVFIPTLNVAVEYDGEKWHQDINRDLNKDKICVKNNIHLIRIREPKCPQYDSNCSFIYLPNLSDATLATIIKQVLSMLGVKNPDVNFSRDFAEIASLFYYQAKEHSLAKLFPNIAKEWHPSKNGNLTPESVFAHSGKRVWWQCGLYNHEWFASINNRTNGRKCPHCYKFLRKFVYCKELNRVFKSIVDAHEKTGVVKNRITEVCRGIRKYAGTHQITGEKLHWYYVEDQTAKDGTIIQGAISLGYITYAEINILCDTKLINEEEFEF